MKTALITGVGRGIGKALAQKFLKEGYSVVGTTTSGKADLSDTHLTILQLDLANPESIATCAEEIEKLNVGIDLLINNAGIAIDEEESSSTIVVEYLRKTLEVNLIGTIDFTERIIPFINEGGQIINISSRAGSLSTAKHQFNVPAYRISKAGLNMLTRILAQRLEGKIRVSSIHPGWVKTEMGGFDADLEPSEVAGDIFEFLKINHESGQFWHKGERFPW